MTQIGQFHHIGMLTLDLAATVELYTAAFRYTATGPALDIKELGIRVCALHNPEAPPLEIIQPSVENSSLGRFAANGVTGYHLAWASPSLKDALAELEAKGFHHLPAFASPLWDGALCVFSIGPAREVIEIIELPKESI